MPERMAFTEEAPAERALSPEIRHLPEMDLILNPAPEYREAIAEIVRVLEHGAPAPDFARKYFIKTRRNATRRVMDLLKKIPPDKWGAKDMNFLREAVYAMNSLANEMKLAPKVAQILARKEAQGGVRRHGFTGIDFIPPLVGIIERRTRTKRMAYPVVDGKTLDEFPGPEESRKGMIRELQSLFREQDIEPADLEAKQVMVTGSEEEGYVLHLIDIEGYYERAADRKGKDVRQAA